ncbi:MAG: hypothetical protein Q7R54_02160 [bacterium]|nr:hypothetical protein [bacterium]
MEPNNNKTSLVAAIAGGIGLIIGLVIGGFGGYYYANQNTANITEEAAVNPYANVTANPVGDVKTNPLEGIKTNPFE